MKKIAKNSIKINNFFIVFALFLFVLIIVRLFYLGLCTKIDGINIQQFAAERTTEKRILTANRGTIYDKNGQVLAQNVFSYTLIAYLDESRTIKENNPRHVIDKEKTAEELSKVISMPKEEILSLLNQKDLYQTEFGKAGNGLTEIIKDQIVDLNLPGIDFIESVKRYYPYGDFLSYTLGYVKINDGIMVGEMGVEKYFNKELSGTNGSVTYQKDLKGYQIPGSDAIKINAINGHDIYLSIDANIQLFVEQALKNIASNYQFDWATVLVADAKTGAILASSSNPSFDPNLLNITNYLDPNISFTIEPGSIMKTYTYMAALETGKYNGNNTFLSGSYITKDGTKIRDWDNNGWGEISYDYGYALSSNVGIISIINEYLSKDILKKYFKTMGFGQKTGITLPNEAVGKIEFEYETEILNSGFGQGITTTPIQHIQGLTAICNDGSLLKPFIVNKIVNDQGEITKENKKTVVAKVASKETTDYMKNLMEDSITKGVGTDYAIENVNLIGKTGTSQIAGENGYLLGDVNSIRSFTGIFPKEDPQIILYISIKRPEDGSSMVIKTPAREIIKNIAGYLNIKTEIPENTVSNIKLDYNFINKSTVEVTEYLTNKKLNYILLGDGNKIINQYPLKDSLVTIYDKIFLLTNDANVFMPNIIGWSSSDVINLVNILDIPFTYSGYGFVTSQSISKNTKINQENKLEVVFSPKYGLE
ncbi:MAG: penicillin-binding protein [Tenericutes bacterium]|nr:penicillin-binding protein [Mycoplasmatota bacterium]